MSQTTSNHCPTPSTFIAFNADFYQYRTRQIREGDVTNSLGAGLYGVLVILSVQSVYALTLRRRKHVTTILLSLTILALLASTTTYVIVTSLYDEAFILSDLLWSARELWVIHPIPDFNSVAPVGDDPTIYYTWLYQRTGTAAVMINIILGDAIVWWRACVVWHGNQVVKALCGVFLLATFVLGVLDATLGVRIIPSHQGIVRVLSSQPGALLEDNQFGLATCILSFMTNLVATLLIAYKAWKCRRRLKGYLLAKAGGSQVEKLLALLIESGAIYCAIWAAIVAYQITNYDYNRNLGPAPDSEVYFLDIFGVIINGGLVPVIAIYPTVVIVLVASNNSHMEQGLTRSAQSVPTPVITVGTIPTHHAESRSPWRSDVLPTNGPRWDSEDDVEDTSTNRSEEWKLERIV